MKRKIATVDEFYGSGCGRCEKGGTPECKALGWAQELQALRKIASACGLVEELKWSVPCFTEGGKNIVILGALKDCVTISFFKGALLDDPEGILQLPGENSRQGRVAKFTSLAQVRANKQALVECIRQAMEVEKQGLKQTPARDQELSLPAELSAALHADVQLAQAFSALTPGRKRSYAIHIGQAKQSKTRAARVDKCRRKILKGLGFHER